MKITDIISEGKKNCGCGKDPCETYGTQNEAYDPEYGHDSFSHVVKHKDDNDKEFWAVYNDNGKIVKVFYSEKSASDYAEKNHDALMKNKIKADEGYGSSQPLTSIKPKAKKVKERDVVEAIPKSTMYGLVIDGKYVAKGSKADMMKMKKEKGGTVYNAPGKKVGDSAGTVKERYGMRQGQTLARDQQDDYINMNKRFQNRNQDRMREPQIRQQSLSRKQARDAKRLATGIPGRILNPPQGQG